AHGSDTELNVFFERDAELFCTFANVFARDTLCEEFVLHAALYGIDFEIEDTLRRADVRAGGEEARQLIAREERVLEGGLAGHVAIIGMGENGANNFFRVVLLAQDLCAFRRMALVGGVLL